MKANCDVFGAKLLNFFYSTKIQIFHINNIISAHCTESAEDFIQITINSCIPLILDKRLCQCLVHTTAEFQNR